MMDTSRRIVIASGMTLLLWIASSPNLLHSLRKWNDRDKTKENLAKVLAAFGIRPDPSLRPSSCPSFLPSLLPSFKPPATPSNLPSTRPSQRTSASPSSMPSTRPLSAVSAALLEMCAKTARCSSLDVSRKFDFVHISKCAGSSWIRLLKNLLPGNFFPIAEAGAEFTVAWTNANHPADYHLISLKSPRHHVWSLFTECKYDKWGIKTTSRTSFPRSGTTPESDIIDFELWLDHFLDATGKEPEGRDFYNCYHASNFQTRHLVETRKKAHGLVSRGYEPNFDLANITYWNEDWVALADFYHESKCLLFHRLHGELPVAQNYLDHECICPQPNAGTGDIKVTHHFQGHRSTLRDISPNVLSKVGALTRVDMRMYTGALAQFFKEIAWLESDLALNRRVLCEPTLQRLEPELAYLGMNVTDLYYMYTTH